MDKEVYVEKLKSIIEFSETTEKFSPTFAIRRN